MVSEKSEKEASTLPRNLSFNLQKYFSYNSDIIQFFMHKQSGSRYCERDVSGVFKNMSKIYGEASVEK